MRILAIDPGPTHSGYVILDTECPDDPIEALGYRDNLFVREFVVNPVGQHAPYDWIVLEKIISNGHPVGNAIFETCVQTGRFIDAWSNDPTCHRIPRKDVALAITGTSGVKAGGVKVCLLDRFPQTGGGARPAIGTKDQHGPLYPMKATTGDHHWNALELAVAFQIIHERKAV